MNEVTNYKPLYKPNQMIYGEGKVAVVTGWTLKEFVARRLKPQNYAAIGQLYSPTRGISFLIRNLLANPRVRYLLILDATKEDKNAGGCECLLDFFRYGFDKGKNDAGKECWVVSSPVFGCIDIEISSEALELLRCSITWRSVKTISEALQAIEYWNELEPIAPWGEPLEFPTTKITPTVLPGTRYGHRISGKTIAETWVKIVHRVKTTGTIRPTAYDGQWQELIDLMAIVTDEPPGFYFPDPNYLPCDREFISSYIPQMLDDAPYRENVKYSYGQRLRSWFGVDQIDRAINNLVLNLNSTREVMSLWAMEDGINESPPCLNHIWLRIVDGELSLTATFRSNDMFAAWPSNAMGLRALQQHIRDEIADRSTHDLKMGSLITVSQSAHIYDDCWENADELIKKQYTAICKRRDYDDPSGNFVVAVSDKNIVVEHTTPGSGSLINCYSGTSAAQIYRQIAADCPALQTEHALYLGAELQKAEIFGSAYEQDKHGSQLGLRQCN